MVRQSSDFGNPLGTSSRSPQMPTEDYDRVSLRDLTWSLWRRKWIILGCALLGMVLAGLIVREITPTYTAQAKIMLNAREGRVSTEMAVVSDLNLSNPVVESEVTSITSNVLLGDVVDRIGAERLAPLQSDSGPSLLSQGRAWAVKNIPSLGDLLGTEPEPGSEGVSNQPLISALKRNLLVQRSGESYVIFISMTSPSPVLSAEVANTVAAVYIDHQLEERRTMARRATLWLDERVQELRGQVEAAEGAVEKFRADQLVLDGTSLETVSQQLVTFTNQLAIAKADLASAQARYDQIQEVIRTEGVAAAARLLSSPLVASLRERRASAAREEAVLATRYEENNSARQELRAETARIDADLTQEISNIVEIQRNDVEVARLRADSLQQSLTSLEQQIIKISQTSVEQRQLEREAAAIRQSYEELLSRLSETRTQEALQRADAKSIEVATPPGSPSAPRTKLMVATGGVVGAALGLGLAFMLELGPLGFSSAIELERATGLQVVTVLPKGRWRDAGQARQQLAADPYSMYGERIRHLRAALSVGREEPYVILMTSSLPGEGKSTAAIALAHMNALANKKVILVDCDMRRPSLRRSLGLDIKLGLGHVLRGTCALNEAIVTDPRMGFSILPMTEPEPLLADQLRREQVRSLLTQIKSQYDIIILDASPVLSVSDAFAFADLADICLYVVHWRRTSPSAVQQGLGSLTEMRSPEPLFVLNMVDPEKMPNAYYGSSA